ncbi:uncharacterized protein VP01_3094g3 [Puccinia sorghi]|uniref:Uncharacterized protein n=1 Tax=Puccinia sorghi TaxID=27349 RepID=A0A0L6V1D5_9BASI|nr:uncharacterized protein VP01_3094g3 [Puccinia sorghi]
MGYDHLKTKHKDLRTTNLQRAMALYQKEHSINFSTEETLAKFKNFQSNINLQIFISINEQDLQANWLQEQIEMKNNK